MILPKDTDLFHVHTFRCKHAEETGDEEYIKKAIKLGKTGIWFTDHAPFPGNPFGYRMAEYFPSFDKDGYYKELLSDSRLELIKEFGK